MSRLTATELPEARRIYNTLDREIRLLQSLHARLKRRIDAAQRQTRGTLHLSQKEKAHASDLITTGMTSYTTPRGEAH